jgi:hypothetical protein
MTWLENLRIQTKQKTKEVKDLRSRIELKENRQETERKLRTKSGFSNE